MLEVCTVSLDSLVDLQNAEIGGSADKGNKKLDFYLHSAGIGYGFTHFQVIVLC